MGRSGRFIYTNPGKVVQRLHRVRRCVNCTTSESPAWRSGPNGETVCNRCGLQSQRRLKTRKPLRRSNLPPGGNSIAGPSSTTIVELLDIPPCGVEGTISGLLTSESDILPWVGHELEAGGSYETVFPLNANAQAYTGISTDQNPELRSNLGDCDRGWGVMENLSSRPPDTFPPESIVTYEVDDHTPPRFQLDGIPVQVGIGWMTQNAGEPNHLFGNILQDREILDMALLPHNEEQATGSERNAGEQAPLTLSDYDNILFGTYLGQSGEPSNYVPDEPSEPLLNVAINLSASPHASSSPSQFYSALPECREPETRSARTSSLIKYSSIASNFNNWKSCRSDSNPQARLETVPQPSTYFPGMGVTEVTGTETVDGSQCACLYCVQKLFFGQEDTITAGPHHGLEQPLIAFYSRAAAVHRAALQCQSSLYVATETFICEIAGENLTVIAFAVLRQELELVLSKSSRFPALIAAGHDLEFGHVTTDAARCPISVDDFLLGQSLVKHLSSERTKSAIWDMSRLPPGHHLPDSKTFRWLQRTLLVLETSAGQQIAMNVQSGSNEHKFRRLHGELALIKHVDTPFRLEMYASLESRLQDACIESCQEWFIAVLDEFAKCPSKELRFQFLEANRSYMLESMQVYMLTFHGMNLYQCLHICSLKCASHVQPSFRSLVDAARDALQKLFSPLESLLGCTQEMAPTYPTPDELFLARVVGLAQFKFYFSYLLLSRDMKTEHSITSRPGLANARLQLAEKTQAKLIWNYLPVDAARRAAAKLALATKTFEMSQTLSVM